MLENHRDHIKRQFIRVSTRWMLMLIIMCASTAGLYAQRTAFLYLQSEEGVPFYVKKDKQIYSSTASGYLILSKLPENDLLFYVGFPGSSNPESLFRLPIGNGGKGVLIKSFGERGWGLFDFQDASVTYAMATENDGEKKAVNNNRQPVNDPFANMLSDVTKDSSVKYIGEMVKQPVVLEPKDSVKAEVVTTPVTIQTDSSALKNIPEFQIKNDEQSEVIIQTKEKPVFPKSEIIRSRIEPESDGTTISYVISNPQLMKDTVNVFIPSKIHTDEENSGFADTTLASSPKLTDLEFVSSEPDSTSAFLETQVKTDIVVDTMISAAENVTDTISYSTSEQVQESASSTLIDTTIAIIPTPEVFDTIPVIGDNQRNELLSEEKKVDKGPEKNPILKEVNCKKTASEEDFLKARRKMAQQSKDEEMINEAMKFFKNMCFTTEQIRNLGVLFLNDEGRYRFYDTSMKYVLDFQNFRSLENTLITPYYKKRFEALLPE